MTLSDPRMEEYNRLTEVQKEVDRLAVELRDKLEDVLSNFEGTIEEETLRRALNTYVRTYCE